MGMNSMRKIISITLVVAIFAAYGITGFAANSSSGGVFQTDFSSEADLSVWKQEKGDPSGVALQEDHFILEDGTLKAERQGIIVGILYKNETYENLLIEAEVNKMTRFQFRVGSDSTWSDERFYIEIDFGGAIILRDQDDVELSSTLVYNLVSRVMTKVKIRVYGNTVEVYLHDNTEPDFTYTDEQLVVRSGYFSMMFVWQDPNIDNIKLTKLDSQGLYNGVNPITGEGTQSSAPVSSGYNYGSSAVSSSAPASSSVTASSEAETSLPASSDPSVSEAASSADEISKIEEISESNESQGSQEQTSSEAVTQSETSTAASSSDDEGDSSALKWLIPMIAIVAVIAVAAVIMIKKKSNKGEA